MCLTGIMTFLYVKINVYRLFKKCTNLENIDHKTFMKLHISYDIFIDIAFKIVVKVFEQLSNRKK